jgi:uncharacterized membrane protein YhiD involved in acid resistance
VLNNLLDSAAVSALSPESLLLCTLASLVLGLGAALIYMYRNTYTKSFVVTLALLPAMIQIVIMMVNGNLGTGVAVMGAFSLVRFRSVPGSAKEIGSIFFAMALGLATGTGYVGIAFLFLLIIGSMSLLLNTLSFGEQKKTAGEKELKITIPENLDYTGIFDDLFRKYTHGAELVQAKTTNMGSLFELKYHITLKAANMEKPFIDELRCRNGNLSISCGRVPAGKKDDVL